MTTRITQTFTLPTRSTRRPRGCSFKAYLANTVAANKRVEARGVRLDATATSIRAALPATEGQLTFGLRAKHTACDVATALQIMIGNSSGAETTGEVVVIGYLAGGEVLGLR